MFTRLSKMLMNAADTSPGGGASTAAPSSTAAAPAQGTAPATVTTEQLTKALGDSEARVQNGVFAALRKAGLLKGKDATTGDGAGGDASGAPAGGAAATAPGVSATDVQKLIDRATAVERIAVESKLTPAQRKRMDAALKAENPDDVASWSKAYLEDMGIAQASTTTTTTTPNGGTAGAGAAPRGPSSSDRGAPGRDAGLAHQGQVWKMTPADVHALIREKGYQVAARELRARMRQDLRGVKLLLPRPGS